MTNYTVIQGSFHELEWTAVWICCTAYAAHRQVMPGFAHSIMLVCLSDKFSNHYNVARLIRLWPNNTLFRAYLFSNHFKGLLAFFSREQTENSFETNANTFSRIIHCPKMKMNEKKTESVPISIPRADNVWEIRGRFVSSKIPKCEKRFIQQNFFVRGSRGRLLQGNQMWSYSLKGNGIFVW